jgi:hypothetical protein
MLDALSSHETKEVTAVSVTLDCTEKCEAAPICAVCGLVKAPFGRSVPLEMANSRCNHDCAGYRQDPRAGHLWPGELARSRYGHE